MRENETYSFTNFIYSSIYSFLLALTVRSNPTPFSMLFLFLPQPNSGFSLSFPGTLRKNL